MRIVEYYAENFKRLRVVEFRPTGRVTMFTGKNDQGKTSALDAIAFALGGKKWSPEMPMRKGAKAVKVRLDLGEIVVQRTNSGLTVEAARGTKAWDTPQKMLDSIFDELSFDPMTFTKRTPKEQADLLRKGVTLDVDLDKMAEQNLADYNERRQIQREADQFGAQASGIAVMGDQAPARVDVAAIGTRIREANEANRALAATIQKRADLAAAIERAEKGIRGNEEFLELQGEEIVKMKERIGRLRTLLAVAGTVYSSLQNTAEEMDGIAEFSGLHSDLKAVAERTREKQTGFVTERSILDTSVESKEKAIAAAQAVIPSFRENLQVAQQALENAPAAELIDTAALQEELRQANETNRSNDQWAYREQLLEKRKEREAEARRLTRQMDEREEIKRKAIGEAKMPVEGLTFDDEGVYVDGVPISQLGEARQIKIGIAIILARNPKLRLIRIPHGEALDEETLAELATMAEEKDFYVWMAKVDSSGKVGIYLEDGEVKAVNE